MSQTDLAVRSGISRNQVSRIENGVHRPKLTTRVLLAHALSCDPRKLFPDLDDPQTPTDQE